MPDSVHEPPALGKDAALPGPTSSDPPQVLPAVQDRSRGPDIPITSPPVTGTPTNRSVGESIEPPVAHPHPAPPVSDENMGPSQVVSPPPALDPPSVAPQPSGSHAATNGQPEVTGSLTADSARRFRWYQWPGWIVGRSWDLASLCVILAVVSAIPVFQLASLGYLLTAAANLAQGKRWSTALPGLRLAGKLGTFALCVSLSWLPVWLINHLSYSMQLLQPGSFRANAWRVAAFLVTSGWVVHVFWAGMRGGRWWHMLWPAPIRFVREIWRPRTWGRASDALYECVASLQFPRLWWLGARAVTGALMWIIIPVSMMIIGLRAQDVPITGLVGLIGAIGMTIVMLYLPFLQIQMAIDNRFSGFIRLRTIRRRFRFAPLAHAFSLLMLCLLCIPLYLLRIEATPAELLWAPSLVFVIFMLPAKIMLGAAMGYAHRREHDLGRPIRHWTWRWPARLLGLASVLIYVGSLYVAQLVAGQGALVMYFQHAFLVPAPLIST